jgi:hypothetical protein
MAPFAAFHAARVVASWQAAAPRPTAAEAADDDLWRAVVPDEELW